MRMNVIGFLILLAGCATNQPKVSLDDRLPHMEIEMVDIPGTNFRVGRFEVTRDLWEEYVDATGDDNLVWKRHQMWFDKRYPVELVSYIDVSNFIVWLNSVVKPATPYRLPTLKEWTYAARGGVQSELPWGEKIDSGQANCGSNICNESYRLSTEVGTFKPNGYGLYDVVGNVAEWTSTCVFHAGGVDPRDIGLPNTPPHTRCDERHLKGGSYITSYAEGFSVSYDAFTLLITKRVEGVGFRLAQDVLPNDQAVIDVFNSPEQIRFREIRSLADAGDVDASMVLARMYETGEGVQRDFDLATTFYAKAAARGHLEAQYISAKINETAPGIRKNYREALKWYRMAAERGHVAAQFGLGMMYMEGKGIPVDLTKAHAFLTISAKGGSLDAQRELSILGKKMSKEDINASMRMSSIWEPNKPIYIPF